MNTKTMTADECFKAIALIEGKVQASGKDLTAAQKKQVAALEKRLDELMPDD